MKPETCRQIMDAVEIGYQRMGCQSYEDAMEMIQKGAAQVEEFLEVAGSRSKIEALLLEGPEPESKELSEITFFCKTLPYLLRKVFPKVIKELPHDPGGRPPALTSEESREVCEQIGKLTGSGTSLIDAQKRVSQRKNLSLHTIQRCWQKRREINRRDEA